MHSKIKIEIFVITLLLFSYLRITAQLRYPIVGQYMKQSAQGMAIWDNKAYLFNHGGHCRVLNLKSGKIENDFILGSAAPYNHVNNACFGMKRPHNSDRPYLYISECKPRRRCFVECLNDSGSVLVQTIEARKNNGKEEGVLTWVVDSENGYLYAITRNGKNLNTTGVVHNYISKYQLPKMKEGEIVRLCPNDRLELFEVQFPNILQGAKIMNGLLYIVTGLQETARERKDSKRAIQVIDLKQRKLIKTIDLTYVTTNEPEDIDFYNGKCLLYCGQNGGIYEVDLNK